MKQWPQEMLNGTTTRSPTAMFVTADPTASTIAHRLVSEDVAWCHERGQHLVQVEVGTAQSTRRHTNDRVGWGDDRGVGDGIHLYVSTAMPHCCAQILLRSAERDADIRSITTTTSGSTTPSSSQSTARCHVETRLTRTSGQRRCDIWPEGDLTEGRVPLPTAGSGPCSSLLRIPAAGWSFRAPTAPPTTWPRFQDRAASLAVAEHDRDARCPMSSTPTCWSWPTSPPSRPSCCGRPLWPKC